LIEAILQTHVQVSNGDFQARAPLSQDNLLWQIAHLLNNLIGRIQNYIRAEAELEYARETIIRLTDELQEARRTRRPVQVFTTKTFLDPFLQELAKLPLNQPLFQIQSSVQEKDNVGAFNRSPRDPNKQDK
jgi:hypothetical protein